MIDMVVQGVSAVEVAEIIEELCSKGFSKSTMSRYTQQIDEAVETWRTRRLDEQVWPFVQLDAMFIKVREDGHVRSMALMIATAIGEDGVRRILGYQLGHTEYSEHWSSFLSSLLERGLSGVDVVTSDAHEGLVSAIQRKLPNALWQRCQTHFHRNMMDVAPKRYKDVLHKGLDRVLLAENTEQARSEVMLLLNELERKCSKALTCLEDGWEDACAVLRLPEKYRKRLRTTNMLERLNGELRSRDRVIRIYPNQASAIRLMSSQLIEQDENWSTQKCYMTMDAYFVWVQAWDDDDLATSIWLLPNNLS